MSEATTSCPKCGAAIPPEAPQGLCPKCLLQQASFPTETDPTTRHARPTPPNRDELAAAFPHLQILELIGQGGMGFVYKARQPKLDRLVALKILAQPLAEQTQFAERFTREGRTLAKLNHPNIVTIHDFGQAGPFFYLLMEYVDGVNLRQAMRAGAVNSSQALAIVPRICEALQYAHNEGVLHRDIKPDNILLDTRGRVKIADFGIAKLMAEAVAENPLTGSGASLGTPHYMAPEQIEKPNAVDHRADIYSLGVVFYEMLTGELPLGRFAAPSEKPGNDPRLDEIVFQTLEKQPDRRPQSADEVKTKVETIASNPRAESGATAAAQPVTFKMSRCYITTPQFLQSWFGRFFRYTGSGELRLDEENLTFSPRGNWIVMPLRSITNLSLCDLPGWAGRFGRGLKLISITFTEKSQTHRLFFIPNQGAFSPIWETNRHVEEWFGAIQNATRAKTGRIPPSSTSDLQPLPSTSTSKTSFSSAVLKGAFTLALIVILGLGVGLGVFIGLYALLRHPNPRQPDTAATQDLLVLTSNTAANATAPAGPTKSLHLAFDYFGPSPEHNINLKGLADLANDEFITTAIRYNDADWSFTRFSSTWDTQEKVARLHWPIPENFSIPFDLEPVVTAFFHHAPAIPIQLSTNGPLSLFTVTNSLHQRITLGIAYSIAPATNSTAKLSNLAFRTTVGGFDMPCATFLPSGMAIEAWSTYAGGSPTTVRVTRDMPGFGTTIAWKYPEDFRINNLETVQHFGRFKSPPFAEEFATGLVNLSTDAFEAFAITNDQDKNKVWRGFIKMIPVDVERASNFVTGNLKRSTISNSPKIAKNAVTEALEITLFRFTMDPAAFTSLGPRTLTMDALVDLNLDEDIFGVVRPLGENQTAAHFGTLPSDHPDSWHYTGPGRTNRVATFTWVFPEGFGMQVDILPKLFSFWGSAPIKNIRVQTDSPTRLFSITNALGQAVGCDLEFRKKPAFVKDLSSGIVVARANGYQQTNGIRVDFSLYFPPGTQVIPYAIADGKREPATCGRYLEGERPEIFCEWEYPKGFLPPAIQPDPSRTPMGNGMFSVNPNLHPPFMDNLTRAISASDARITASKPLEIFAITNAEGKVFRGMLEISHARAVGQQNGNISPELSPDRSNPQTPVREPPTGPTKELPLRFKAMLSANALLFEAPIDLAFSESIRTVIRYNDSKWSAHESPKYEVTRGPQNSRTLSLDWSFPESFSYPFDIKPVLDQLFEDEKTKLVRLSPNQVFELFSATNGLKQRISCGLKYETTPASPSPFATVTNNLLRMSSRSVDVPFYGLAPAGMTLEPVAKIGTNNVSTSLTRSLIDNAEARFTIPPTFKLEPGGHIPEGGRKVFNIGLDKPAELFSLTNSDNQIYRAFLELREITK